MPSHPQASLLGEAVRSLSNASRRSSRSQAASAHADGNGDMDEEDQEEVQPAARCSPAEIEAACQEVTNAGLPAVCDQLRAEVRRKCQQQKKQHNVYNSAH